MSNSERIIRMQYPDGIVHEIEPESLICVRENVYILSYFDRMTSAPAKTILLREGGTFYKQPLTNYTNGWDIFCRNGIRYGHEVDVNLLPDDIQSKKPTSLYQVTQMISSNDAIETFNQIGRTATALQYVIYHNQEDNNYTIVDVNKLKTNNQVKGKYIFPSSNKKDDNGIKFEDEYEESIEEYLFDRNTLNFYLKESDAKKFHLKGNKFNIKFSYYGNAKEEADGEYIQIPIFDIKNEETKRILDANKKEIEDIRIIDKKGAKSIRLYNAQDGARYLLKSPFLDKYIDNYNVNIDFQDTFEHLFSNKDAILYTPELRMELEKEASEQIYFIEENVMVNRIKMNINNIKGINKKIDYLKDLRNNIQKSISVDDYYNSDDGFIK